MLDKLKHVIITTLTNVQDYRYNCPGISLCVPGHSMAIVDIVQDYHRLSWDVPVCLGTSQYLKYPGLSWAVPVCSGTIHGNPGQYANV